MLSTGSWVTPKIDWDSSFRKKEKCQSVLFIYFIVDVGEKAALFLLTAWIVSRHWGLAPSKEDTGKRISSGSTFNLEYRPLGNVTVGPCWIFAEGSFYACLSIGLKQDQD